MRTHHSNRRHRPQLGRLSAALAVAAAAFSFPSLAHAALFQVGPGKIYTTLGQVAPKLQPGDVVELQGGATYPGGVLFTNPGTASNKITIRGIVVNGKRPILSGGTNTIEAAANHYVFDGLELTGGSSRCFYHHAHDITLRNSIIHDCPAHGVLGADSGSGSLLMEHSEVYRCGASTTKHQVYMATDETHYPGSVFRMEHCYIHAGNGGNNIKSRAERNEIYYNWIEGAMYHEVELIGPAGALATGVREDSDVVGNVIVKKNGFYVNRFGGDGTGETRGRYRFVNNTVIVQPSSSAVFRLFDGIEAVEIHNNVFATSGSGGADLVRDADAVWVAGRRIAGSNNWIAQGSTAVPSELTATLTGSNPGFANLSGWDLRPTASSPLVDSANEKPTGVSGYAFPSPLPEPLFVPAAAVLAVNDTGLARPSVGTLDIGAYEYGSSDGGSGGAGGSGGDSATGGTGGTTSTGGTGGATSTGGTGGSTTGGTGGDDDTGGTTSTGGTGGKRGKALGRIKHALVEDPPAIDEDLEPGITCSAPRGLPSSGPGLFVFTGLLVAAARRRRR